MSETPDKKVDVNQVLRYRRLVFYSEEIDKINEQLTDFLDSTQAKAVLVVDIEGHLVTKMGYTKSLDTESLSALIAGSFASTTQVANILGEEGFNEIFHQGKNDNIFIALVHERSMIVVIFDDRTTIGMVKFYADSLRKNLDAVFTETEQKRETEGPKEEDDFLQDDFSDSMKSKLDDLFGL